MRARLELAGNLRDLALFNVAIDSKLRGCDLVGLTVGDLFSEDRVRDRLVSIGLEPNGYGTHSMRRTKVAEIYRKTGNLRAVQLLLGHTKVDSTVRYLGVELEDALNIAEQIDI